MVAMHTVPTWATMLRSPRVITTGFTLLCVSAFYCIWFIQPQARISYFSPKANDTAQAPSIGFKADPLRLKDVYNATLGFEKVFVVNLASRPDKLDQFTLVSSLTGFKVDVVEGVVGHDVQNKALPSLEGVPQDQRARDNIVGCWRAHLDFARRIVDDELTSALVMEDDADWDTSLKDQLNLFAQGSQFVTGVQSGETSHSPYGNDWDLIWLGHCGNEIKPGDDRRFVIDNDATVPAAQRRANFGPIPDMSREGYDNKTRIIYRAKGGVCLYAYALSYHGARKLLRDQATRKVFKPIDLGIGDWCEENPDVKCIGVFPQIVDSHKAAGRLSRDSDIGDYSAESVRQQGFTFNIVHSTRLNLDHLLNDERDKIERQWPADPEVSGPPRVKAVSRVQEEMN